MNTVVINKKSFSRLAPLLLAAVPLLGCQSEKAEAQSAPKSNYVFTPVTDIAVLPVTSQGRSGTCWAYSTSSFLESEIIRLKGEKIDLSKMYFVRSDYMMKTQNYVYRQGTARFSEGGLSHDAIVGLAQFGMMPKSAYTGLINGATENDHAKMFADLEVAAKKYASPANKLGDAWKQDVPKIMDSYMGKAPDEFTYEGKTYTPKSFLAYTKLNPDDYLTITSFTHLPFYKPVELSIPANWANERFYNLPLDEFMANIDSAVAKGYSLALDLDASEPTFNAEIGVWPENKADAKLILTDIRPEKNVTPQERQQAFENFDTTDDHLVHIVGTAKDQKGNLYYKAKNSWGRSAGRRGYVYLSVAYMRMKAISVLLHKDGLTKATRQTLAKGMSQI